MPDTKVKEPCPICQKRVWHVKKHIRNQHPEKVEKEVKIIQKFPAEKAGGFSTNKPLISRELDKDMEEIEEEMPKEDNSSSDLTKETISTLPQSVPMDLVQNLLEFVFTQVSTMRKSEAWKLSKDELSYIAPLTKTVADKHLPDQLKRYPDEIALSMIFVTIVIAKFNLEAQLKARETRKTESVNNEQRRNENGNGSSSNPGNLSGVGTIAQTFAETQTGNQ